MDAVGFLLGFGALQGLILALALLFARSGHRPANAIMSLLVATIAVRLLQMWLARMGFWLEYPSLVFVSYPLKFAWGPLLFLYAFSLTGSRLQPRQLLHFLPVVLVFLYANLPHWQLNSDQQTDLLRYMWGMRNDPVEEELVRGFLPGFFFLSIDFAVLNYLFDLHFGGYCLMVLFQVRRLRQRLEQHYSSLESMNQRWLRGLTVACLVYLAALLVFSQLPVLMFDVYDRWTSYGMTSSVVLVLLILGIGFSALLQPSLISGVLPIGGDEISREGVTGDDAPTTGESAKIPSDNADSFTAEMEAAGSALERNSKYARSGLSLGDAQRIKMRLMEIMQKQELYLNCDLTLPDLATETGLSAHQISQVINGQMNENFFSFVNSYRIGLAQRLLSDRETAGMPIVELAIEVGFKSKSSFYDAFKRTTDMTPTQYRKTMAEPSESEA